MDGAEKLVREIGLIDLELFTAPNSRFSLLKYERCSHNLILGYVNISIPMQLGSLRTFKLRYKRFCLKDK